MLYYILYFVRLLLEKIFLPKAKCLSHLLDEKMIVQFRYDYDNIIKPSAISEALLAKLNSLRSTHRHTHTSKDLW